MERLRHSIASICPHLQIKMYDAKIISDTELVFEFHASEQIEPLYEMLRKYGVNAQIDIVENWKFLFIVF